MPKKSKMNIFNVMSEDELNEEISSKDISKRYYERLIAMRLISMGFNHKEVSEMLLVSYTSIYRWAKQCEEKGLEGLVPNFNGGRKSKFTEEDRKNFKIRLKQEKNLSMTGAQNILRKEFNYDFSLPYVCRLVRELGFNYGKPRPKFNKEPENAEEILKKNLEKANITKNDIVITIDESTTKIGFQTEKSIYPEDEENIVEKPVQSISVNFLAGLGINSKSFIHEIKNLTEFEFGKELFKIRKEYTEDETTIRQLEYILNLYDLTNKEVTEILEEYEDPSNDFEAKLSRSMKYNKNKSAAAKARIFGKHCKKNSTENKEKRVNVRRMHIYNILRSFNFNKILKKSKRIAMILDNAKAHKTDLIFAIADSLNFYLVPTPPYTPRLNPTEKVWDIEKKDLKRETLETREDVVSEAEKIFKEKCCSKSLTEKFVKKYLPNIC